MSKPIGAGWRAVLCVAGVVCMVAVTEARQAIGQSKALLPVVDLSRETARHVVIAAGTPEVYQGHPTTVSLPDGTILATTYLKYWKDARRHSVVCTRFNLSETDARVRCVRATRRPDLEGSAP